MAGNGATGAVQVWPTDIPRELYHTDWVAQRTKAWLDTLSDDEDWFVWMSFPDPHHPWDPPAAEKQRIDWRDTPLPELYPGSPALAAEMLKDKPKHWIGYFDGSLWANLESPRGFKPCDMTPDQIREINAYTHIENELIDEACADVFAYLQQRGWDADTDILFTTDHGELQGDYGLLFKGAYHVDSLMRLPLSGGLRQAPTLHPPRLAPRLGMWIWPRPFAKLLVLTSRRGLRAKPYPTMKAAPKNNNAKRVLTEWESEHGPVSLNLQSIYQDNWVCTRYSESSLYAGTEGELYNLTEDPGSRINLWDDPACAALKSDLIADLDDNLPEARQPKLPRLAPV
jgi:arylsulfatase A-like enzyme